MASDSLSYLLPSVGESLRKPANRRSYVVLRVNLRVKLLEIMRPPEERRGFELGAAQRLAVAQALFRRFGDVKVQNWLPIFVAAAHL
jgi:hypothetical protein